MQKKINQLTNYLYGGILFLCIVYSGFLGKKEEVEVFRMKL